jgi:hypothetical protein
MYLIMELRGKTVLPGKAILKGAYPLAWKAASVLSAGRAAFPVPVVLSGVTIAAF